MKGKEIDGTKVELVIREIYDIFGKFNISPNEGASIAGMIITNCALNASTIQTKMLINGVLGAKKKGG